MKQTKTERLMQHLFEHIVDSSRGIYMAQRFAISLNLEWCVGHVKGLTDEEWETLLKGPNIEGENDEAYWLAAEKIDQVRVTVQSGVEYMVYWNDGIYLYPSSIHDDINWDEII
jgi:hypothetical protein